MPGQAPPAEPPGETTEHRSRRIRRAIARLTDPADLALIRRQAERKAGLAESAGDDQEADYWQAVSEEVTATIQVGQCHAQPGAPTGHAHPYRF